MHRFTDELSDSLEFGFRRSFPIARAIQESARLIFRDARVAFLAWQDMKMEMRHRLAGIWTIIPSKVEAGGSESFLEGLNQIDAHIFERLLFLVRQVFITSDTSSRSDQNMSWNDRDVSRECPNQLITNDLAAFNI